MTWWWWWMVNYLTQLVVFLDANAPVCLWCGGNPQDDNSDELGYYCGDTEQYKFVCSRCKKRISIITSTTTTTTLILGTFFSWWHFAARLFVPTKNRHHTHTSYVLQLVIAGQQHRKQAWKATIKLKLQIILHTVGGAIFLVPLCWNLPGCLAKFSHLLLLLSLQDIYDRNTVGSRLHYWQISLSNQPSCWKYHEDANAPEN